MVRRSFAVPALGVVFVLAFGLALVFACASTSAPGGRYPSRPANCDLTLFHTPVPGMPVWDDLGIAEAACHINTPEPDCLRMLKAEACRLGGDVIYNVPLKPFRPQDQVMLYRGQVAHSRVGAPKKEEDEDLPPPASPEESAGPVIPLSAGPGSGSGSGPEPGPGPGPDAR